MTIRTFVIVPTMVLARGAATAMAQSAAYPFAQFDRARLADRSAALRLHAQASAMAANAA